MVDSKYQKQGIGGALTKWGTDRADEMGAEVSRRRCYFSKGAHCANDDAIVLSPRECGRQTAVREIWFCVAGAYEIEST
jgi:hypothetical protein